jgi:hypothetical protein
MRDRVSEVWPRAFNGGHAASVSAEMQKVSMRDGVSAVYIVSLETLDIRVSMRGRVCREFHERQDFLGR